MPASHLEVEGTREMRASSIMVWDPAVRVFHWSLVAAMAYELLAEPGTVAHNSLGQAILGLLGFRVLWGIVGPRHARFSDFMTSPATALSYMRDILKGHPRRYIGHNPAGAMMVIALIAMVGATAASGWAMTTDALWGQDWIEELHAALAYGTLVLIVLHVAGVVVASWQHRENLVRAMVTGIKRR